MPFQKGHKLATGRTPGVPNKLTMEIKEMVRQALDQAGGVEYLRKQAQLNPGPFMALIGKIIPSDVNVAIKELPKAIVYPIDVERPQISPPSEAMDGLH